MTTTGANGALGELAAAVGRVLAKGPPADVTLWVVDLTSVPEAVAADRTSLTADELESAARRRSPAGDRYARRRLVRRALLAAHAGIEVGDVVISSVCRWCGDPSHGKPVLTAAPLGATVRAPAADSGDHLFTGRKVEFNDASCGDVFVLAVSGGPVGVDVERPSGIDDVVGARLDRFTTRRWPAFDAALPAGLPPVGSWTAGEALSKAVGLGLWASAADMASAVPDWTLRWIEPETDLMVCVATTMPAPMIGVRSFADALAEADAPDVRADHP